jgi:hypothetical protein
VHCVLCTVQAGRSFFLHVWNGLPPARQHQRIRVKVSTHRIVQVCSAWRACAVCCVVCCVLCAVCCVLCAVCCVLFAHCDVLSRMQCCMFCMPCCNANCFQARKGMVPPGAGVKRVLYAHTAAFGPQLLKRVCRALQPTTSLLWVRWRR